MLITKETVKSVLDSLSDIEASTKKTYKDEEGKIVPRVTEVISAMIHEDSLLQWANNLGWKRISYKRFLMSASDKGTFAHMAIEQYLRTGKVPVVAEMGMQDKSIIPNVQSCLDGFLKWWNRLNRMNQNVEMVFVEESMIHSYFGGTCDCLLKVDGKYHLIDFKTSSHMNYNYGLQLSAYRFLLRELKNIDISKASILLLNKFNSSYTEYAINLEDNLHKQYMDDCEQTFLMLVASYKMRMYTLEEYQSIFGDKKGQ